MPQEADPNSSSRVDQPQECPRCRLWSPAVAINCDCGYNFVSKTAVARPKASNPASPWDATAFLRRAIFACLYGALLVSPWGAIVGSLTGDGRWTQRLPILVTLALLFFVPAFKTASAKRLLLILVVLFVVNLGLAQVVARLAGD